MTRHRTTGTGQADTGKKRNALRWKLKSKPKGHRDPVHIRLKQQDGARCLCPFAASLWMQTHLWHQVRQSRPICQGLLRKLESTSDRGVSAFMRLYTMYKTTVGYSAWNMKNKSNANLLQVAFVGFTCCPARNCRSFLMSMFTSAICSEFLSWEAFSEAKTTGIF